MSRRAIARAVSATVVGLGAVVPAIVLAAPAATAAPSLAAPQLAVRQLAAPAVAAPLLAAGDCCQASIGGLPGKFVIGADPSQFTVSFTNSSQQQIDSLTTVFVFSGNALDPNQITMKRRAQNGSWQGINVGRHNGAITATDSRFRFGQPIPPNGSTNLQYQLSFDPKAAPTQVQLGVTINGRLGGRGFGQSTELAATGAQFSVVGVAPPPAPKPTAKPTPTPTEAASTPASTPQSAAGIDTGPGGPPITPGGRRQQVGHVVPRLAGVHHRRATTARRHRRDRHAAVAPRPGHDRDRVGRRRDGAAPRRRRSGVPGSERVSDAAIAGAAVPTTAAIRRSRSRRSLHCRRRRIRTAAGTAPSPAGNCPADRSRTAVRARQVPAPGRTGERF